MSIERLLTFAFALGLACLIVTTVFNRVAPVFEHVTNAVTQSEGQS